MKWFASVVLGVLVGYVLGAISGYAVICLISENTHDKAIEAAMVGAFLAGPLGAVAGAVTAFMIVRRKF